MTKETVAQLIADRLPDFRRLHPFLEALKQALRDERGLLKIPFWVEGEIKMRCMSRCDGLRYTRELLFLAGMPPAEVRDLEEALVKRDVRCDCNVLHALDFESVANVFGANYIERTPMHPPILRPLTDLFPITCELCGEKHLTATLGKSSGNGQWYLRLACTHHGAAAQLPLNDAEMMQWARAVIASQN